MLHITLDALAPSWIWNFLNPTGGWGTEENWQVLAIDKWHSINSGRLCRDGSSGVPAFVNLSSRICLRAASISTSLCLTHLSVGGVIHLDVSTTLVTSPSDDQLRCFFGCYCVDEFGRPCFLIVPLRRNFRLPEWHAPGSHLPTHNIWPDCCAPSTRSRMLESKPSKNDRNTPRAIKEYIFNPSQQVR